MKYKALSLVSPNGSNIASGKKTVEVRSWRPTVPLGTEILIIENEVYLKEDDDIDPNGKAVALATISNVRLYPHVLTTGVKGIILGSWQISNLLTAMTIFQRKKESTN